MVTYLITTAAGFTNLFNSSGWEMHHDLQMVVVVLTIKPEHIKRRTYFTLDCTLHFAFRSVLPTLFCIITINQKNVVVKETKLVTLPLIRSIFQKFSLQKEIHSFHLKCNLKNILPYAISYEILQKMYMWKMWDNFSRRRVSSDLIPWKNYGSLFFTSLFKCYQLSFNHFWKKHTKGNIKATALYLEHPPFL